MKKSVFLFSLFVACFLLVGYGPRPYSDLATYKRIPTKTRVENLQKAGEDLFTRRRFEDARSIFQMILNMDKDNLDAKLWISKIDNVLGEEQNERNKEALYKKWGHLTPIDKIYENWHWGPEVGHFEVRYSEPKPYVPAVRKFRPAATDEEVNEALNAYKKSKSADDAFELAMRYWSQRKKKEAIKYYFEAADISPLILGKDDEYMLSMISEELEEKFISGKGNAEDYFTHGRLALIQGNQNDGIKNTIKSVMLDKKYSKTAYKVIDDFLSSGFVDIKGIPDEVYSFRQAYVFDKDKDSVYMRIILSPKDKRLLIPIDTTIPASCTGDISCESKDTLFVFGKPGIGNATRLWIALPEKEGDFPEYEVRLIMGLKRGVLVPGSENNPETMVISEGEDNETVDENDEIVSTDNGVINGIELSNYSLPRDQPDNWSFIITSEFNNTDDGYNGNYEKVENGIRVSGYHLGVSDGKGPFILFDEYKESLPKGANIWKIIANNDLEMSLL